jgi:hypothetical protein
MRAIVSRRMQFLHISLHARLLRFTMFEAHAGEFAPLAVLIKETLYLAVSVVSAGTELLSSMP